MKYLFKINKNKLIVCFLFGLYFFSSLFALKKITLTLDEPSFYGYGVQILKGKPSKNSNLFSFHSKMPVTAINGLPRAIEQVIHPDLHKSQEDMADEFFYGRLLSVFAGFLVLLYVFKWSKELYGFKAGLLSLFLGSLSPNLIAHSQFIGTDVYAALATVGLFYHAWKFKHSGSFSQLTYMALFLGFAEISKQSLLFFYPVLILLFICATPPKNIKSFFSRKYIFNKKTVLSVAWIAVINLFLINAAFLFYQSGKPIGEYHFISMEFQQIQKSLSSLGKIPLPLPAPFLTGLDGSKYYEGLGGGYFESSYGNIYLLGVSKSNGSFWNYYFVVLFFKLTIPFLLGIAIAALRTIKLRKIRLFFSNEAFIVVPVFTGLILFSFFYKAQVGIRHILFILPLLQVWCGICIYQLAVVARKTLPYLLTPLCALQAVSVMSYFQHFLPFTNEFISNKMNAYKYIGDSNLYYGEGGFWLKKYMELHPGSVFKPTKPKAGLIIISINDYIDVWNTHEYDWLEELQKQPVDHIHSQYLIFKVSEADMQRLGE